MPSLPTGTVTFLFTDIEGSTRLLQQLKDTYADVLVECRRLVRKAVQERGGQEVDTEGDAVFAAFPSAREALMAAVAAQQRTLRHPWPDGAAVRVRMGLHTGEARVVEAGYVGMDVHRAARIAAVSHGGQIVVSDGTYGLVAKDLPEGVSLRDLGEHRLKDLAQPHRLFQVVHHDLSDDFPPLRSLDAHPHNLPLQLTSFIGRVREIAEIKALLSKARLVTLTGSGGAGKTRLALQAAADVVEGYPDGVWLVEFAPIADPALVPKTVATALSVPEQPGRAMTDTLVDALRPKALLLVLDNCEHLLAACADLAAALLRACPQVRMLATSREGLGVPGETLWRVPSLSLPDVRRLPPSEDLVLYEAVRLFVDRAAATASGFTVTRENAPAVARVCHQLDGIPLAIELAAARVKVLAVEQIAARLDDRFRLLTGGSRMVLPRHQTLRAAIDWSYHLLSEPERTLLRQLSVFAGGWSLAAAEAVCAGHGVEAPGVLDLLTSLVDKSLVLAEIRRGEARYRLLETVRQYGLDRLIEAEDAADVRRRHRDWHQRLAEQGEAELWGPGQRIWLDRLEEEHDNLRAALAWSMAEEDNEAGLKLAGALWWFWFVRCYWTEGRAWLERTPNHAGADAVRAKALVGAAFLAWRQGDYDGSVRLSKESLALCERLQDRRGIGLSLHNLGLAARFRDDYSRAVALGEKSLALFESVRNEWGTGLALVLLGSATRGQGDYERATHLLVRAVALLRQTGDTWGISRSLMELAHTVRLAGDDQRAKALYEECLPLFRDLGDNRGIGFTLVGLGRLAYVRADYERARTLGNEAAVLFRQAGDPYGIGASSLLLAGATLVQGDYGRARALYMESLGVFQKLGNLAGVLASLEGLSDLASPEGDYERGTRLLGAADANRERLGIQRSAADQSIHGRRLAMARAALGEAPFADAWAEGRAMTLEQAIEYALKEGT